MMHILNTNYIKMIIKKIKNLNVNNTNFFLDKSIATTFVIITKTIFKISFTRTVFIIFSIEYKKNCSKILINITPFSH